MADQLSLGLDPALPALRHVAPMLPVARREPFDSADHLFGPWWRGRRVLALLGPGSEPRILDASGTDLAPLLPELRALGGLVAARSAAIDGELVAVGGDGRTDTAGLRARLAGAAGPRLTLLAIDLLHRDGAWLLGTGLEARHAQLRRTLADGEAALVVPVVAGEGCALARAAAAQGIGGVLARARTSPYLPGVRSRLWRSVAVGPGAESETIAGPETTAGPEAIAGPAPVLTLLRRLPLDVG